ncbi:hypothetical protein LOD99_14850 [Oopsacas minuta]|uniref:RING-type domain-containing protein n=1 Tax=Oopsacas minuta TaxID=111878 RepID=A0AAV7KDM5_9METZ|nr:hypothetical protein LOD99_14850 [Oopsacas minuta]
MDIALEELEFGKSLASCVQCELLNDSTRLLPCSHVLCEDCYKSLGSLSNFICPECDHDVKEDEYVEENYFAELFIRSEKVLEKLKANHPCSKCKHLISSIYCITCESFLCSVDFHIEHKEDGDLSQHDYICVNKPKKVINAFEENRNVLRDIFVKSREFKNNEKVNILYQDLTVYEHLLEIWRQRYQNIEFSFDETKFQEIQCVSEINTYYGSIIEEARTAMIEQSKEVAMYYDNQRKKLQKKLSQTTQFLKKLEQTKGLIDIYIQFSDSYELIDKSSALIGRIERIGKEIVETKWQFPDVVPVKFEKSLTAEINVLMHS